MIIKPDQGRVVVNLEKMYNKTKIQEILKAEQQTNRYKHRQ